MKAIINIAIILSIFEQLSLTTVALGQGKGFPEIGRLIPGFAVKTDQYNGKKELTSDDLLGTHYILDFWTTSCGSCITGFSKADSLQNEYHGRLKIILIGLEEKNRAVKDFYNVYSQKLTLRIRSYFDSITFKRFVPRGVPHLIWVNDKGLVKAITLSEDLNRINLEKFLSNEAFKFYDQSYEGIANASKNFDPQKPLLINNNGGSDAEYLYRSIISPWVPENARPYIPAVEVDKFAPIARYQTTGVDVKTLYALAFYGHLTMKPFIEPMFSPQSLKMLEERFGRNRRFNYCVELPKDIATTNSLMLKMQTDLASFFGFDARKVDRSLPCYELIVVDENKFSRIVSISGEAEVSYRTENKVQKFRNISLEAIIGFVRSKIKDPHRPIIFNETHRKENVTFEMSVDIDRLESVRNGLQQVGLDLKPSHRTFQVIEVTKGHY